ncbi:hypothetical protein LMG24235_00524 [Paraburkholderia sabiae]|nr:hypothetical protein LMG24235_00524 [Paraburkholderia sabiae]
MRSCCASLVAPSTCASSAGRAVTRVPHPSMTMPILPNARPSDPPGSRKPMCSRPGASTVIAEMAGSVDVRSDDIGMR